MTVLQGQGLQKLNTTGAREHVGEVAIVCGHVVGAGCSRANGGVVTLATDNVRSQFQFRIPSEHREKFGRNPEEQYLQRLVCAAGRIEARGSRLEVVVSDPSTISILPDRPELPSFAPDAHRPCDPDVELPKPTREVKPSYTERAMQDRAAGVVLTQAVVNADGRVGDVRVVRGLHDDLDVEAIKAVRQWRFVPGTLRGQPAPVMVTIELTFTLRK
jgi:TonB family protein